MKNSTIKKAIQIYKAMEDNEDTFILALRLYYRFKFQTGENNINFLRWIDNMLSEVTANEN